MDAMYGGMNEQPMRVSSASTQRGTRGRRDRAKPPVAVGLGRPWSGFSRIALLYVCLCSPNLQSPAQSSYATAYTFTTFAGYAGEGSADGIGGAAQFYQPRGIAVDRAGNVYVADTSNETIRKMTPAGVVTTIAGFAGVFGSADGTNGAARFNAPSSITIDTAGNLYVADFWNCTIRQITPVGTNWVVSTIAGLAGQYGSSDGTSSNARFDGPAGIAVDSAGNLYVADYSNDTIRKLMPAGNNWIVTTVAGLAGTSGSTDDTGNNARFNGPNGIAVDSATNLYVTDTFNCTIRKITPAGVVTTIAGGPGITGSADGTNSSARFDYPSGVAVDSATNLYVTDDSTTIRKIALVGANWVVNTLAGLASWAGSADGTGSDARFWNPEGIAVDSAGNLYVADTGNSAIRSVTSAGVANTLAGLAGSAGSANGTGSAARFYDPTGVAVDSAGKVYVADSANGTIREVTSAGVVGTLAGAAGTYGSADCVGDNARFYYPEGVAADRLGNVYVADSWNNTIRKVTSAGVVSTIAGLAYYSGSDDGTNSAARFYQPQGVTVDSGGNLYVADSGNFTIRRITLRGTNWVVTTLAGVAGSPGFADGVGSTAQFGTPGFGPAGLTVDDATNIFVADTGNDTIRRITPAGTNWIVSTIAGLARNAGSTDGSGGAARFYGPNGITVDSSGSLYVVDGDGETVRKIIQLATNWFVTTVGGLAYTTGSTDGAGSAARFYSPMGIAVDGADNIYVADEGNNTIRKGVFSAYTPTNPVPYTPPPMNGQLLVTLLPADGQLLPGQWCFPWDVAWRDSGQVVSNLAAGNYTIVFRNLPGYLAYPPTVTAAVTTGGMTQITSQYYPTLNVLGTTNTGALTVNIGPSELAGTGWRFLGETAWRAPGSTAANLVPDTYIIEFAPVNGYSKPAGQAIQVSASSTMVVSASYLSAPSPPAGVMLPVPVPTNSINDLNDYPYGFNGQLLSDVGYGSGVAVQTNVVLTAAHLVFNDQTLSYAGLAFWYVRGEAGVFTPEPLAARGFYMLSGYAAQRTNDLLGGLGPDQSSPQSRNLDVAALYFPSPVAGGGYGGYLPSDTVPNTWLTSTSQKMLVGYPVDGSVFGDASIVPGAMYQIGPQPYPLSLATDPVADQQVYVAPWLLSYPGNSGGPLYVQFNGYYYPAGVYLGTLYNGVVPYASLVRGIDSNVVNLVTLAATLGGTGTNYSGGGVVVIAATGRNNSGGVITIKAPAGSPLLAYVQVPIGPAGAVAAGAAWRVSGTTGWSTGATFTEAIGSGSSVTLEFKPIPGWNLPTNNTVQVTLGVLTVVPAIYTPNPAQMAVTPAGGLAASGYAGGPFSPAAITYTLTNTGGADLNWSASKAANWLTLSASSGTVAAGVSTNVTVSVNANANSLAPGSYSDKVGFTNLNNGLGNTAYSVSLLVTAHPPVQFTGVSLLTNGAIAMTFQGVTGRVYSIVASTNLLNPLINWAEVLRLTNTGGQTTFTNPPPLSSPQYYRAKEL